MKRQICTLALLGLLLVVGGIFMVAGRTPVSETERRQLAQWPQLTWQSLYTGRWMQDAEQAAADQFPCRDLFRHGKAQFVYHVLLQGENNGIYLRGGSAAKLDYPLNEASVSHLAQVILDIQNTYLKDTHVHCYYSIVPDKNAYLAGWYPTMDYHRLTQQLEALLPMTYVDLFPCLTGDSYYRTDPHWRQDALQPVVEALTSAMDVPLSWDLTAQDAGRFSGAYTGQSGLPLEPDRLRYLTGSALASCTARDLEGEIPLYDWEKAQGRDPYEFFLSGASPIQVLENPAALSDRELVVFRDSFGSSLAPLLAGSYRKITLIDLRYISSDLLESYVRFQEQDVLFLYSALIWNQSGTIR